MLIANNILKRSLENVYFFVGTACGGKTTMCRALAEKYGFIHFNDNWNEPNWNDWEALRDPVYQPYSTKKHGVRDWEAHFSRTVEEVLADEEENKDAHHAEAMENIAFSLVEIIKLSQHKKVLADIWIEDFDFLLEISDRSHIACLLAPIELIIRDYYQRADHADFTRCIQGLKNPEEKFKTQNELFRIGAEKTVEKAKSAQLFTILRSEDSTVEKTLLQLEKYFGLEK
ncbi:MAG: AAA family ATPase [Defluviitaleaceae bacterium]|nr:AAA family ATPase [Defluviitaleaceae bacterium]MCL2276025.1 AAA family ATPase [Defluviitaleaceae bacterium]